MSVSLTVRQGVSHKFPFPSQVLCTCRPLPPPPCLLRFASDCRIDRRNIRQSLYRDASMQPRIKVWNYTTGIYNSSANPSPGLTTGSLWPLKSQAEGQCAADKAFEDSRPSWRDKNVRRGLCQRLSRDIYKGCYRVAALSAWRRATVQKVMIIRGDCRAA